MKYPARESLLSILLIFISVCVISGQSITPIRDIQYVANPDVDDASPLNGTVVTISGVVTAEFWGSYENYYFHVQDTDTAWSGILCYDMAGWDNFSFIYPDTGYKQTVAEGDSVTVTGIVNEYNGLTEIWEITEVIVHGPASNPPEPIDVATNAVTTGGQDAERYEGMLVRVQDITIASDSLSNGDWSVDDDSGPVRVATKWDYYFWPEIGAALDEVVGVLDFIQSEFKIQPRLARDVVEAGGVARIQRIQQVLLSDLLRTPEDAISDRSYLVDSTLTVEGIITTPVNLLYAGDATRFLLQDERSGPWSAITCYFTDVQVSANLGDKIRITVSVSEYTTLLSNQTWLISSAVPQIISTNNDLPSDATVITGDLRLPVNAEQWESGFVTVEHAIVIDNAMPFGEWTIDDGTGATIIDDESPNLDSFIRPSVGREIISLTGYVYHHYGFYSDSSSYAIEPLYQSDIVLGYIAAPENLRTMPGDQEITLLWSAVLDPNLAQYNIYRSLSSPAITLIGTVIGTPPDSSFIDSGLVNVTEYFYRITAENSVGIESDFSNEVYSIPNFRPNWMQIPDTSFLEDGSLHLSLDEYVIDEDEPDSSLIITVSISSELILSLDSASHELIISSQSDAYGFTDDVTVSALDSDGLSGAETFSVTVVPVNDAPVANLGLVNVAENGRTEIALTGVAGPENESDQILTTLITTLPSLGGLSLAIDGASLTTGELPAAVDNNRVYYIPPESRFVSTTFSYQVIDDGGTDNGGVDTSDHHMVSLDLEVSEIFSLSTGGPIEGGVTLIDNSTIYAAASGDNVYRFDNSGSIEYTLNVNGDIKSSTTLTSDHTVYIASTDNNLYSFNSNGVSNPNWPLALGAQATASVAMDADRNIYIGTQNGIFQAVSPGGDIIWSYNVGAAVYASAAISVENILYIINNNGRLFAFDLNILDPTNIQYLWRMEVAGNVTSSPALDDSGHVYLTTTDGRLVKILDDGVAGEIVWEYDSGSPIESSPVIGSDYTVYFGCDNGKVYAVDITGNLKWEQTTNGPVKSTAALVEAVTEANSRLYIGSSDGFLYAIALVDGAIIWKYNAQSEINAPTMFNSGIIYTGTADGQIIAIADTILEASLGKTTLMKQIWPTFQGDNARTGYQGSVGLSVANNRTQLPYDFALHQNYPNPFNPTSTIQYDLPEVANVGLVVYDILGREVITLINQQMQPGYHRAVWDARDHAGRTMPTGIYIARLVTPEYSKSIKMLLLK